MPITFEIEVTKARGLPETAKKVTCEASYFQTTVHHTRSRKGPSPRWDDSFQIKAKKKKSPGTLTFLVSFDGEAYGGVCLDLSKWVDVSEAKTTWFQLTKIEKEEAIEKEKEKEKKNDSAGVLKGELKLSLFSRKVRTNQPSFRASVSPSPFSTSSPLVPKKDERHSMERSHTPPSRNISKNLLVVSQDYSRSARTTSFSSSAPIRKNKPPKEEKEEKEEKEQTEQKQQKEGSDSSRKNAYDFLDSKIWDSLDPAERHRQETIYEVISTEAKYVMDMITFECKIATPMKDKNLISNAKKVSSLFTDMKTIVAVNKEFCKELNARQKKDEYYVKNIADIFLNHVDKFSVYIVYCGSHTTAVEELKEKVLTDDAANAFVQSILKEPWMRGLTLESFMIMPLQRVCKYPLLLRELLKSTEKGTKEHDMLLAAEEKMKTIVNQANERTRKVESVQKLVEIQSYLDFTAYETSCGISDSFTLMASHRAFVAEWNVTLISDEKEKEGVLFLFNDLLIVANPSSAQSKKRKHKVKMVLPLVSVLCRCGPCRQNVQLVTYEAMTTARFASILAASEVIRHVTEHSNRLINEILQKKGEQEAIEGAYEHSLELGFGISIPAPLALENLMRHVFQQRLENAGLSPETTTPRLPKVGFSGLPAAGSSPMPEGRKTRSLSMSVGSKVNLHLLTAIQPTTPQDKEKESLKEKKTSLLPFKGHRRTRSGTTADD